MQSSSNCNVISTLKKEKLLSVGKVASGFGLNKKTFLRQEMQIKKKLFSHHVSNPLVTLTPK